jgi:protein-tyrosine phosphatase
VADATSIHVDAEVDPTSRLIEGYARHGNTPFSSPFISNVHTTLWVGGCTTGLVLPPVIKCVVSLYPWERYTVKHELDGEMYVRLYDADLADPNLLLATARIVNEFRKIGPTLVHCQAGLNRSSLIAGLALVLDGMSGNEAVETIRRERSAACLCNPEFEEFLLHDAESYR